MNLLEKNSIKLRFGRLGATCLDFANDLGANCGSRTIRLDNLSDSLPANWALLVECLGACIADALVAAWHHHSIDVLVKAYLAERVFPEGFLLVDKLVLRASTLWRMHHPVSIEAGVETWLSL